MKKTKKTFVAFSAFIICCGLIAGLATAANHPIYKGISHHANQGKVNALQLDSNKDGALSQEELLSKNKKRFTRLDNNGDGSISSDEFNASLVTMFERMDYNRDGLISADEIPKSLQTGR